MGRVMQWMYESERQELDARGKTVTRTVLSETPPEQGVSGKVRRVRVAVYRYNYGSRV